MLESSFPARRQLRSFGDIPPSTATWEVCFLDIDIGRWYGMWGTNEKSLEIPTASHLLRRSQTYRRESSFWKKEELEVVVNAASAHAQHLASALHFPPL